MRKEIILILLLMMISISLQSKSIYAEDYYCRIDVRDNGDIQVRETIQYRFLGGDFRKIERSISEQYTDGVEFIRALMKNKKGEIIKESRDYFHHGSGLKAEWNFEPVSDTLFNFELEFLAKHVCYEENGMLYIRWQSIPEKRRYPIRNGSVEMILPEKTEPIIFLFPGDNRIETGYNENRIWWNFHDLREMQKLVTGIALNAGSLAIEQPDWQKQQAKAEGYYQYFMKLAILLGFLIVALIFYMIYRVFQQSQKYGKSDVPENLIQINPELIVHLLHGFNYNIGILQVLLLRYICEGIINFKKVNNRFDLQFTEQIPEDSLDLEFYQILGGEANKKITFQEFSKRLHSKKNLVNKILLKHQVLNGNASEAAVRKQRLFTTLFGLSLVLLLASIAVSIMLINQGILSGLFISFIFSFLIVFAGFKFAGISLFTEKGLKLKYGSISAGKILNKELAEESEMLEVDDFDTMYLLAVITGNQRHLIEYFNSKAEVRKSAKLLNAAGSEEELLKFLESVDRLGH